MTNHIGTNTPKLVPSRWPPFNPTQTGLCKLRMGLELVENKEVWYHLLGIA